MKIPALFALAVGATILTNQTNASFITGNIDFSSISGKTVKLLGPNSFLLSTGLDFPDGPNAAVDGATGSFAGELGTTATFFDFYFATGANPVWQLTDGHFSFDLNPGVIKSSGVHFLAIDGVGTVHDLTHVLSDTPGEFILTTQGSPSSKNLRFSWSAETDAAPVPESGTIIAGALLLLTFTGAAIRVLRKRFACSQ